MKKLLIPFLVLTITVGYSQNKKTKKMLKEIEGSWQVDDNNNVSYVKIIDSIKLKKDDIFNRVKAYIAYNYNDGNSVVQVNDKEKGLIIGKGLYGNSHIGGGLILYSVDTYHILRVDVKDNRARITVTLTQYNMTISGGSNPPSTFKTNVSDNFPVDPKGRTRNQYGRAFYKSHFLALSTIEKVEKAMKEGTTFKAKKDDW